MPEALGAHGHRHSKRAVHVPMIARARGSSASSVVEPERMTPVNAFLETPNRRSRRTVGGFYVIRRPKGLEPANARIGESVVLPSLNPRRHGGSSGCSTALQERSSGA